MQQQSARVARLTRSVLTPPESLDTTSLEAALVSLAELSRLLVGADFAAVTAMDSTGTVSHMFYAGITEQEAALIGPPPVGRGVLGHLGTANAPLRLDHISSHPRSVGFPPNHPPMEALLGVHVQGTGQSRINLYVANRPGHGRFSEDDEERLSAMAARARLALENMRLYETESELRHKAEEAERRLDAAIRTAGAGVAIIDAATGRVVLAGDEMSRITGMDFRAGEDYRSLSGITAFRPDGTACPFDDLPASQTLRTGRPVAPVELIFQTPSRRRTQTLSSAAPVSDARGQMTAVIAVVQDITRVKELDQVKSDFLSMVTHDLRTPLATLKGIAAEARDLAEDNTELRSHLEAIDEEADHVTDLVSNLLDMSRIEAGVSILDLEQTHLTDIVDDAVRRARRSRYGAGREINAAVPGALPPVYADPAQIGRVMDNLISNALKYSGGPVSITGGETEGGMVRIAVSDRGEGIPVAEGSGLFDKFFRVRTGRRRGREGAGLGLAICKALLEAHGGRIGVDSVPRKGSTFWFCLPVDTGARQPASGASED